MAKGEVSFRHRFSPRLRVALEFSGEGRTKQSFKDECDINRIMGRYLNQGILPAHLNQAAAQFVDCSAVDFQEAQFLVAGAKSLFADLPASVRERFHHSPAEFLEFAEDPANGPGLAEMGLATLRRDFEGVGSQPPAGGASTPAPASPGGVGGGEGAASPQSSGGEGA